MVKGRVFVPFSKIFLKANLLQREEWSERKEKEKEEEEKINLTSNSKYKKHNFVSY